AISKTGCGVTSVAPDGTMYFTAAWSRPAGKREDGKPKYKRVYGVSWFNPERLTDSVLHYTEPRPRSGE
ncbi:MAG: hypothetical protein ACYTGB_15515, partial [Planctomycetota bacterium]